MASAASSTQRYVPVSPEIPQVLQFQPNDLSFPGQKVVVFKFQPTQEPVPVSAIPGTNVQVMGYAEQGKSHVVIVSPPFLKGVVVQVDRLCPKGS